MPRKLLVIDDDDGLARVIGLTAMQLGFEYQTVQDPHRAVQQFVEYRPDITLVDMIMPQKDGIDVLHEILSTGIPTKIVLTSGFGASYLRLAQGVSKFHSAGHPVILEKPFRRQELVDILGRLVADLPAW